MLAAFVYSVEAAPNDTKGRTGRSYKLKSGVARRNVEGRGGRGS